MLVFLVLGWPGIFKGDEYYIIPTVLNLQIEYSQSLFTCLFYIISLCMIPTIGGITFFQILIISVIVGYIMSNIDKMLKGRKIVYLLYLPLLLPPVIDNNLFTLRSSIISYLFLLTIFQLIFYARDSRIRRVFYVGLIIVILIKWKMEFMYLPIFIIIYLLIFYRKVINIKKFIFAIFVFLLLFIFFGKIEKKENYYVYTATINPLQMLATYDNIKETIPKKDIENIEKYVPFEKLRDYATYYNIDAIGQTNYNLTGKDKTNFFISYTKLVLANPLRFLKVRFLTFAATNFPNKNDRINQTGWESFDSQWTLKFSFAETVKMNFGKMFKYTDNPFGSKFKKWFVCTLLMRNYDDYSPNIFNHLFYNVVPSVILSLIACIILIIKKKWKYLLLVLIVLLQLPLIFLTAPANFWMYYMPLYLNLNFILTFMFVLFVDNKMSIFKQKKGN